MEKIVKISFCGNDICVVTDSGKEYRKALEFFPTLKEATPAQRECYQINKFGDAVRWAEIDEDIHISSLIDGA